ncbi:MAG: alpha/beta hydrolase [Caldilineaceae bacterium]|nr:alpha/beta hydrolase [Caldilineaceae bacterium]
MTAADSQFPIEKRMDVRADLALNVRHWPGDGVAFVLLHGLASNARTWDGVAHALTQAGHAVYAVDQRGHGLSDKPADGYDFATVTEDLSLLLDALQLDSPIVAGQSWGGNVVLAFGAHYPKRARGLGFVDGGFLDLQSRPENTWERVSVDLRPPNLVGAPAADLRQRLRTYHPDWTDAGVEATLNNFEILPDGTIRPRLTLERHMQILRALWEQRPGDLYGKVSAPVVICPATSSAAAEWTERKRTQVAAAEAALARVRVHWFEETDHDIHVQKPDALAGVMVEELLQGIWRKK